MTELETLTTTLAAATARYSEALENRCGPIGSFPWEAAHAAVTHATHQINEAEWALSDWVAAAFGHLSLAERGHRHVFGPLSPRMTMEDQIRFDERNYEVTS